MRPVRLCFEFERSRPGRDKNPAKNIVWAHGRRNVKLWLDYKKEVETAPTLEGAVSVYTGFADGASSLIPAMLVGSRMGGFNYVRGAACRNETRWRRLLSCRNRQWDRNSHSLDRQIVILFRKIFHASASRNTLVETTTTYNPVLNGQVTEKMLAFSPPQPTNEPEPQPAKIKAK